MAKHRDPLPDDLKELIALCRDGKLFAVQDWIASGSLQVVSNATIFHFGILSATMHMAWM